MVDFGSLPVSLSPNPFTSRQCHSKRGQEQRGRQKQKRTATETGQQKQQYNALFPHCALQSGAKHQQPMLLYPVCFTSPLATVMVPCSRPCSSQACPWMQHSGGSCLVPAYRCSGERSGQHPPTLLLCLANTIQKCTQAMCASRSGTPGQRLTPTSHCSPLARTMPTEHYSYLTRSERKREGEDKTWDGGGWCEHRCSRPTLSTNPRERQTKRINAGIRVRAHGHGRARCPRPVRYLYTSSEAIPKCLLYILSLLVLDSTREGWRRLIWTSSPACALRCAD